MNKKDYIKKSLELQINFLANEIEKCKLLYDHIDDYEFYVVPEVEDNDLHTTKH